MLNKERLLELFEYKDGYLYGKIGRRAGQQLGTANASKRSRLWVNSKMYYAYRLIFLMHHGYLPEYIDHVDGDQSNNKIENLRACLLSENNYNSKISVKNTSGVKGVSFYRPTQRWRVHMQINGKDKSFGYYEDFELAQLVAEEARAKHHGSFARNF